MINKVQSFNQKEMMMKKFIEKIRFMHMNYNEILEDNSKNQSVLNGDSVINHKNCEIEFFLICQS